MAAIPVDVDPPLIEADDATDGDSTYASTAGSDTTSLGSSIFNYVYENGRRYTNFRSEKYMLPNDETEQDRLDMAHHLWNMVLKGSLYEAPLDHPQRVLDLGTGTGIWAIDFGDMHQEAEVIGTDLSAIQPSWVPPNVRFEVDDFEEEWTFSKPFDYIHGRYLIGSVSDWKGLIQKSFDNASPGGYVEFQEADLVGAFSEDNTYVGTQLEQYSKALTEAGEKMGRPSDVADKIAGYMREVGFVNVVEHKIPVPVGTWAKGKRNKELGLWLQSVCLIGAEAYGLAAFTRVLGWETEKAKKLIADAVKDFKDPKIHTIYYAYVVHGRKPLDAQI